jgi:hypothetical protein
MPTRTKITCGITTLLLQPLHMPKGSSMLLEQNRLSTLHGGTRKVSHLCISDLVMTYITILEQE